MALFGFILTVSMIFGSFLGCQLSPVTETTETLGIELSSESPDPMTPCGPRDPASISCRRAIDPSPVQPQERFTNRLDLIEQALIGDLKTVTDQLSSEPVRQASMQIQGLAKIYKARAADSKLEVRIKEFQKEIQSLENAMGNFMRFRELDKMVQKLSVPLKIREAVTAKMEEARKEFAAFLKEEGFWPKGSKKFEIFKEDIGKFEFKRSKKDHRLQLKAVRDLIDTAAKEIKASKKFIEKSEYTHEDLEAGLHTFRREVRWVTIAIQSSDGSFAYAQKAPSTKEYASLKEEYGDSKYSLLPKPSAYAVELDPLPMLRLTRFVSVLGKLKDFKEQQIDIAEIIVNAGIDKNIDSAMQTAYGIVSQKHGDVKVEEATQKYLKEFLRQDPMTAVQKNIETALE